VTRRIARSLGDSWASYSTLSLYFRLFTLPHKKTNSICCTAALAAYLLLFSAFYYLHSLNTASGARYRRRVCIDMDKLRLAAAACCVMGWISAQRCVLCYWYFSVEKDNHVLMQKVVTLNSCCDIACLWHYGCHTSQAVLLIATDDNPQLALFRASNVWKNAKNFQSDKKYCNSQVSVVTFWRGVGKWITVCFLLR